MTADIPVLVRQAAQLQATGRLSEAQAILADVLTREPSNLQALLLLGIIAAQTNQTAEAISILDDVAKQDLTSFQARLWLSIAHRKLGDRGQSLEWAREAVKLNSFDPQGLNQLGQCYMDAHCFAEAESYFRKALAVAPKVAHLYYGLGLALQAQYKGPAAIETFRRAAQLASGSLPLLKILRQALMDEPDPAGAAECSRAILKLQPDSAEANLWLARALIEDHKAGEAESHIQRAIDLEPEGALAFTLLGSASQIAGDVSEAEGYFRKSIELQPEQGSAYLAFASNRKMTEGEAPLLDQMRALLQEGTLSPQHLSQLHYGLGKAEEDLGQFESAMAHFEEANRIAKAAKFGDRTFRREQLSASYDFAIARFDRNLLLSNDSKGSTSALPIFVVGMMRSGTTLAEQILSSHSKVGAAGEQRFWSDHRNDLFLPDGSLDLSKLKPLAAEYESILRTIAPGKQHVVDKMPVNYEMIGLMHLAFPNAKFIHTLRHPVDTAISIYTTPNRSRLEWAHEKGDIVFVYNEYRRLMAHWKQVLPENVLLDVPYEEVISNREEITRRMIAFCGLAWEEACLFPEKNKRTVLTPSVWQVRQPVYKTSVERWKRYEGVLGDFAQLLA